MKVLAGDVGGTNTRLLLSDVTGSKYKTIAEKTYSSNEYASLQQVISCFITDNNITDKIDAGCFAVAGPVKSGAAKITNLPWEISEQQLKKELKFPFVQLVNDFTAVALGVSLLKDEDLLVIQQGTESKNNPVHPNAAIIGAGTGLGVSHRVWINNQYHVLPSETGHVSFPPANELQMGLFAWLYKKNNYVSLESILSGGGIYTIYQYLRERGDCPESLSIRDALQKNDPAKVISEHANDGNDELCMKTLDTFTEIYGSVAGDVVLHYYPVDELYIAGGIAPKLQNKIASSLFLNAFTNKGLMSENLQKTAVKLIHNEKVGLLGALSCSNQIL